MSSRSKSEKERARRQAFRERKHRAEVAIVNKTYPLELVKENAKPRQCGECQACCEVVGVEALGKPPYHRCLHQCETGCGIYENRPAECASYWCLWLSGMLKGEENRPDKLGILFDFRGKDDVAHIITAWELWENAAKDEKVVTLLHSIAESMVVYLIYFKSTRRTLLGPPHMVKKIRPHWDGERESLVKL